MKIPFQTIDWTTIEKIAHKGETGTAFWQTIQLGNLRIRKTGEKTLLSKGQTYVVSDELSSHRSFSEKGVKLLIADGDFLK